MPTLTIRKVPESVAQPIRIEAARLNISTEEYIRRILARLADQLRPSQTRGDETDVEE